MACRTDHVEALRNRRTAAERGGGRLTAPPAPPRSLQPARPANPRALPSSTAAGCSSPRASGSATACGCPGGASGRRGRPRSASRVDRGEAPPVRGRNRIPLHKWHSSGWIRTIDLTIMSRAPPYNCGPRRAQQVGKSLQGDRFGRGRGRRVDPPVFTLVDPWWTRPEAGPCTRCRLEPGLAPAP